MDSTAIPVVPPPLKGSRIMAFGLVLAKIIRCKSCRGFGLDACQKCILFYLVGQFAIPFSLIGNFQD